MNRKISLLVLLIGMLGAFVTTQAQNNALNFDGINDYITTPGNSLLANNSFSVEFWVKRNTTGSYMMVLSQGTPDTDQKLHIGFRDNDIFIFAFWNDDLETGTTYTSTDWHHWAVTYDATTNEQIIYRDGENIASRIASNDYFGSGEFNIGQMGDFSNFLNGNLDELRIWNDVRTEEEINSSMNTELCGAEYGLVAYYNFNQGVAGGDNTGITTLNDLTTTNDFDGTLNNFALNGTNSNFVAANNGVVLNQLYNSGQELGISTFDSKDIEKADIDNDGDLDIIVMAYHGSGYDVYMYLNDGLGYFTEYELTNTHNTGAFEVRDINGDGFLDVATLGSPNQLWINDGNTNFTLSAETFGTDDGYKFGLDMLDIDNDGDFDIICGEPNGNPHGLWLNDGNGVYTKGQDLGAGRNWVKHGDFNGDGWTDVVITKVGYSALPYLNDGAGNLIEGTAFGVYNGQCEIYDLNDDGYDDVVSHDTYNHYGTRVYNSNGDGTFTEIQHISDVEDSYNKEAVMSLADFNGDGFIDLYRTVYGETNGDIHDKLYYGDGCGTFYDSELILSNSIGIACVAGDFTGNSKPDVAIGISNGYVPGNTLEIWFNEIETPECSVIDQNLSATTTLFECSGTTTINLEDSECTANYYLRDNSDNSIIVGPISGTGEAMSIETPEITSTVTYNVYAEKDECNAQFTTTVTITIEDLEAPTPDLATLSDVTAECEVTSLTEPTATDNCSGTVTITNDAILPITAQGTTVVEWTYTDATGNSSTQNQNVIIADITAPEITCIENQEVSADNTHTYIVGGTEFDPSETTDNCEVASITNDFNSLETLDGATLPEGTTTIVWTVTDIAGNTTTCEYNVLVNEFVGINDLSEFGINIYPNPTTGIVNINLTGFQNLSGLNLQVTDISGRIIENSIINTEHSIINLENQPNGVYFIKFQNDEVVKNVKIIKQ